MDEMIITYKVYVKTNADRIIDDINSSAFLADTTGWIEIDEGSSDKYHHAQGNYLDKPLVDENGIYNYKLSGGMPVLRTDEDKQPELDRLDALAEIAKLKSKLAATDYITAKLAEVAGSNEEYAAIYKEYEVQLAERATWRVRINELEQLI